MAKNKKTTGTKKSSSKKSVKHTSSKKVKPTKRKSTKASTKATHKTQPQVIKKKHTGHYKESRVHNSAKEKHNIPIKETYVYGSYAKQAQRDWNDVDVVVVSSAFKQDGTFEYLGRFRNDQDVDHLISPVGFHPRDFNAKQNSLVKEIKKLRVRIDE